VQLCALRGDSNKFAELQLVLSGRAPRLIRGSPTAPARRRLYVANVLNDGLAVRSGKQYSFFRLNADFAGRVKARPADRNLAGDGQRRAFTPAVILFIALPNAEDKADPG